METSVRSGTPAAASTFPIPSIADMSAGSEEHVEEVVWVVVDLPEMDVGRVTTVVAGGRALCVTRTADGWGVLDNRCPDQGGPLGDGQLENGYVICPWHAYEYDPTTGQPPPGFPEAATCYPTRRAGSGGVEVALPTIDTAPSLMDQVV